MFFLVQKNIFYVSNICPHKEQLAAGINDIKILYFSLFLRFSNSLPAEPFSSGRSGAKKHFLLWQKAESHFKAKIESHKHSKVFVSNERILKSQKCAFQKTKFIGLWTFKNVNQSKQDWFFCLSLSNQRWVITELANPISHSSNFY